jgi:hypothetical protein
MSFENRKIEKVKEDLLGKLELGLKLEKIILDIGELFSSYLVEGDYEISSEKNFLIYFKRFVHTVENKNKIREIIKDNDLKYTHCLSLCIITALVARKYSYDFKIVACTEIYKTFHTALEKSDGSIFEISGKFDSANYRGISYKAIIARISLYKIIFSTIRLIK